MTALMPWNTLSRLQKVCWIAAVIWVAIHAAGYIYSIANNLQIISDIRGDTQIYIDAGHALAARAPIYDMGDGLWHNDQNYRYHPVFALVFSVLAQIPEPTLSILWILILTLSYLIGVLLWYRVVVKLQIENATEMIIYLPIALITTDWLGNVAFGNVGPIMVPLSALLVLQLIDRHPARSGLLVAVLLLIKIYWAAFPLVILLVFREWKLLFKIIAWALAAYVGITLVYIVIVGPDYGIRSLQDYVVFLLNATRRFPWRGTEVRFDTFNNSIEQTILRYFGNVVWAAPLTLLIQVIAALVVVQQIWRAWQARVSRTYKPEVALVLAFAVYLVGILALVQIEDVILGGIMFSFLWAFRIKKVQYVLVGFIVYAFEELPALVSLATGIVWLSVLTAYPTVLLAITFLYLGCLTFTQALFAEQVDSVVLETSY